ncbi:MAG: glycoside hydrolase family 6 protein [Solirubrobacterales bacterium]|nr:glycoside hydrolase family 6 protein [Solirubrobacterales bacterium]
MSRLRAAGLLALVLALVAAGCGSSAHGDPRPSPSRRSDPLAGLRLYVVPSAPAVAQARIWQAAGRRRDAVAIERIASQPTATWLTGSRSDAGTARGLAAAAARAGRIPLLTLYDIPNRDCHGYSSGGARSSSAYLGWVASIANAIGDRGAIVILEPDAIDQATGGCHDRAAAMATFRLLGHAVGTLKSRAGGHIHVYIDAGNSGWQSVNAIAGPLLTADVRQADGFALNVANFQTTQASIAYGTALSRLVGGKHFVIDTGRNGAGPASGGMQSWCNPTGRALGQAPTTDPGTPLVDALLWVKYPGESDGSCGRGDPSAGQWWPGYALGLAERTAG